ncbi:S66 peptidase family protein [Streptomyces netropsis]|uniref:Muramoyltetrapeptide carboxypeptidase n=1 Tax=Streptomyces netropsis TaxID=55404 RepID=A0A7W7LIU2_STRNE|nr:S66 peptidase family protein [Streptomyces netropsis]MBB4890488.1 muramoyltetrapeptide carboxypeptidase [Streptomyces netropsis]GGR45695.1 LD-carboxypeptidase [Streptomyces netropsis]
MTPPPQLAPALLHGDTIAVLTLSSPGPAQYPDVFGRGLRNLQAAGYNTVTAPTTAGRSGWTSGTPQQRAADLNAAFADRSVSGIITTIGGNHTAQILPFLDWDTIAANPKVLCGYSDTTVLHHALRHVTRLVTFYGPALIPQWGEYDHPFPYTTAHFQAITSATTAPGPIPPSHYLVHEDHATAQAEQRARRTRPAPPRRALRESRASGPLAPFCLPSLRHLAGTPWQPDLTGHILLIDIPDHAYRPEDADTDLTHLRQAGITADPAALVLLRTPNHLPEPGFEAVLAAHTQDGQYPVITGVEGGHVDPLPTYPVGVTATVDGTRLAIDTAPTRRKESPRA